MYQWFLGRAKKFFFRNGKKTQPQPNLDISQVQFVVKRERLEKGPVIFEKIRKLNFYTSPEFPVDVPL